jgi:hypothetical protein
MFEGEKTTYGKTISGDMPSMFRNKADSVAGEDE